MVFVTLFTGIETTMGVTMRNVIYQYWDGPPSVGSEAGRHAMSVYADRIGAEYIYEDNPRYVTGLGKYSPHYGAFKPIFDSKFDEYDHILFADTDVWPVEHLEENIFEQFYNTDVEIGICEEWIQPEIRRKVNVGGINASNDRQWARMMESTFHIDLPYTKNGDMKVYNSGVVVYSKEGRKKARQRFIPFEKYVHMIQSAGLPPFYTCDQPYLHAMLEVCDFKWITMDYKWNSSVFYTPGTVGDNRPVTDLRDGANFVHVQLNGKHHMDADKLWRITNLSVEEWNL